MFRSHESTVSGVCQTGELLLVRDEKTPPATPFGIAGGAIIFSGVGRRQLDRATLSRRIRS